MNYIRSGFGVIALSVLCILSVLISDVSANDLILTPNNASIGNIVVVSPRAGSSATANGTALLNTLAMIVDASASNKYLIKLGPGTFNLGASMLSMKQYVDIEGSGKELTVITSSSDGTGTVHAGSTASRCTLRNLGINNTAATYAYAVYNNAGLLFLDNVAIDARYGASYNIGIFNDNSSLDMRNSGIVTLTPNGWAIYNSGTQYNNNQIFNSVLAGNDSQVYNSAGYGVDIAFTKLNTTSTNFGAGVFRCFQNYNISFAPATCP
ncbi:MAG: hypothetical protein M0024_03770 [Nitrospiraceae bacterium]|nr:hypothetical protein [Nitrospiraceae bacterium]